MSLRLGLLLYLPPAKVPNTQLFYDHFCKVKRGTEVILYSEAPWPDAKRLRGDPEQFRSARFPDGSPNKFAIPNATFFTGIRIAMLEGYSHVIVVEPDCRFGCDYWDLQIWEEYFNLGFPCIAAGTLACYNPCNYSPAATRKWEALIERNARKNFPIATYGFMGGGQKGGTSVFPNGALAVYDIEWMTRFYDLHNTMLWSTQVTAWDFSFGHKLWERFGPDAYDMVGHLNCIYSGFGELVSTELERQALLMSGKIVAGHQYKSAWVPPVIG